MQLTLRVDQGDGPVEVSTNLFTIVSWERKFKRKASDMASGIGIEDLAYLAHQACQQHNVTVPVVMDDFIKKLVLLEVVSDEPDRPTVPVPTDSL
jgi:hypothetical protein|tara:strand:+ start:490 stop:774 length:285 start_codon:yes stop_codon:yes gene_type:complete